jgi:hypothetical protein
MTALTALGGFAILLSIRILKIIHFYTVKLWHFRYSLEAKADRSSGGTATFSSHNRLDTTPLTNTVSECGGVEATQGNRSTVFGNMRFWFLVTILQFQ